MPPSLLPAPPRPRRHGIHQIQRFRSVEGLEALVEAGHKFQLGPAVMAGASAPILILHGQATHAYLSPWLSKCMATSPIRIRPPAGERRLPDGGRPAARHAADTGRGPGRVQHLLGNSPRAAPRVLPDPQRGDAPLKRSPSALPKGGHDYDREPDGHLCRCLPAPG